MSKRKKEEIKTMHSLGAMDYKNAKQAILNTPNSQEQTKTDYSKFMLDPRIFNELVYISREIIGKNKDADPDKLLDKMFGHKRVKELLKNNTINEGDVRDALSSSS